MHIDVVIPYEPNNLGAAYNRAMRQAQDWVLFLDHDVLTLNPHWYDMCLEVINKVGHKAGFISCKTNRIGGKFQWVDLGYGPGKEGKDPADVDWHTQVAQMIYKKYGNTITDITDKGEFSGFFILTHKEAWKKAGGFKETPGNLFRIDTEYNRAIKKAGYRLYLMEGLYYFHIYRNKVRQW